MGKHRPSRRKQSEFSDDYAPIHGSDCCTTSTQGKEDVAETKDVSTSIQELVVIGAGPHGLSLLLRLLEPDPDFLSDKERHLRSKYPQRMRPHRDVISHVKKLPHGPRAILKPPRKKKTVNSAVDVPSTPPPLSLKEVQNSVLVVDSFGNSDGDSENGWMSRWKKNFKSIDIKNLRSLVNAHADPYDYRSLELYAESKVRGSELVTLPSLLQRDMDFEGPYQVPSAAIFHEFHNVLARAYGVEDAVHTGTVQSIRPIQSQEDSSEPIFEVAIAFVNGNANNNSNFPGSLAADANVNMNVKTVKTKRVVCAMGPMFRTLEAFWENSLRKELELEIGTGQHYASVSDRILHTRQIIPYIKARNENEQKQQQQQPELFSSESESVHMRTHIPKLLIVGGGITSAQLALLAIKATWCDGVTFIQRSKSIPRHFDIENKWMGPKRGKYLDDFWSFNMRDRAQRLQEARRGGSIPPEILQELEHCCQNQHQHQQFQVKEEVQISEVHWRDNRFHVFLDDGSECEPCDMIWLATGCENHIDHYTALSHLRKILPVSVMNGLPILNQNLSWRAPTPSEEETNADADAESEEQEPKWKQIARERFWCMGALAALQLGPDALNLIGARHGAVRVAEAIRGDYATSRNDSIGDR